MTTTYESPTPAATTSGTCTSTPTSFFLVLDGQFDVVLREAGGERTVSLRQGDLFVVPKGTEHKPSSPGGSILMFELSGTVTTGDRHEGEIPAHVDSTTGHDLGGPGRSPG